MEERKGKKQDGQLEARHKAKEANVKKVLHISKTVNFNDLSCIHSETVSHRQVVVGAGRDATYHYSASTFLLN